LMRLMIILVLTLVAALPTRGLPVSARINKLRRKVAVLEHRLGCQMYALNQARDRSERVERALKARIRKLEDELNRRRSH
jgi:predicted Holliday junction resolvase-like endonuclease